MIDFLLRIAINGAALIVAAAVVPGIHLSKFGGPSSEWLKVAAVALIFAIINTWLRPIVKSLSLPISLLTMGLVGLVINAGMLLLLSYVSGALRLPFKVGVFPPKIDLETLVAAFLGGLLVSLVATILSLALGQKKLFGIRL
ncbi:MAG TPA: phage holin family protein [Candidatus Saccharimonadales bacterium]|nr:phage holin family protein [Candidatus Saccharimonadales bacterium]